MMNNSEHSGKRRRYTNLTALQYAVKLLSSRPYSEKKLREKLGMRGYERSDIDLAIDRLRRERLLDDRRFAEDFVRARLATRPRAASALARDLRQRGIAARLAKEVAEEIAPHDMDEELAKELVRRKETMYLSLDPLTRRRRLAAFLARRGFSYDTIEKVLRVGSQADADE